MKVGLVFTCKDLKIHEDLVKFGSFKKFIDIFENDNWRGKQETFTDVYCRTLTEITCNKYERLNRELWEWGA